MQRFLMAAAMSILVSSSLQATAAEKPGAELQGGWRLQSTNGEKAKHAADADQSTLLSFDLDTGAWKLEPRSSDGDDGGFTFYGSFSVDPSQTPKLLDAVIQSDGGSSDVFGIYKVENDVLTLSIRKDGQRSADFEVSEEVTLMVFKRHKTE